MKSRIHLITKVSQNNNSDRNLNYKVGLIEKIVANIIL